MTSSGMKSILGGMKSIRFWFEFLVFNVWPMEIGSNIWFIQSLLFAYVIILLLDKLNVLRFYKPLLVVLFIFMILSGELSGVIGFSFLGYSFIPGGTITRALPYLLLGMLIREKKDGFKNCPARLFIGAFIIGAGMVIGEMILLAKLGKLFYQGHMLGYGIMVIAITGLAVLWDGMAKNQLTVHAQSFSRRIYVLHTPIFYYLVLFALNRGVQNTNIFLEFSGLIVYMICLLISVVISIVKVMIPDYSGFPDDFSDE
jgi:hypothetical protein